MHRLLKRNKMFVTESVVNVKKCSKPLALEISQALKQVIVSSDYDSADPQSAADIDLREFGHLLRISDGMADYIYSLHAHVKPTSTKKQWQVLHQQMLNMIYWTTTCLFLSLVTVYSQSVHK